MRSEPKTAFYILLLSGLLLLGLPLQKGQSQNSPLEKGSPPSPLYLKDLKGDLTFTKKVTYKKNLQLAEKTEEQKAAESFLSQFPKVEKVEVVQTGPIRRDRQSFVDGTSMEIWRSGITRFSIYSNNPDMVIVNFISDTGYQDSPDFPELDWITADCFQGMQVRQDKKCYVYQRADQTAWISQTDLLPVSFESSTQDISYSYRSAPTDPLRLPGKFNQKLQEVNRAWSGR